MTRRLLLRIVVVAALVVAAALAVRATIRWYGVRARFAEGRQALGRRDFAQAAARFQAALELDPRSTPARLELAAAHAAQYVPGGESRANLAHAQQAIDELRRVLQSDPGNAAAVRAIAAVHDGRLEYDEARTWYRRLVALAPGDADGYANLSASSWKQVSGAFLEARAREGLTPEDLRPTPDPV